MSSQDRFAVSTEIYYGIKLMKKLLPCALLALTGSAVATPQFIYNTADGSCMSRPDICEIFPKVSESDAFSAVVSMHGRMENGSQSLVRNDNDIKINGETCYSISVGEIDDKGFKSDYLYAVGFHSGNIYRYNDTSKKYDGLRVNGNQPVITETVKLAMPITPDTKNLVTHEGKIPFSLKLNMDSIIMESNGRHWSQKFSVPVVKADFWQLLAKGKVYIAFSVIQADFKEDSQVIELTESGFRPAGYFSGLIKSFTEDKIIFNRRISLGTIWEGVNFAFVQDGSYVESNFFHDLKDTYHPNSKIKLNRDMRFRQVDLNGATYAINGYSDERVGNQFTLERFYPKYNSPLMENVAGVYFTIQEGTLVLKSEANGTYLAIGHTVVVKRDEEADENEYYSNLEGIPFDELFIIE